MAAVLNFNGSNGNGSCQTGACGSSLKCGASGNPPASLALLPRDHLAWPSFKLQDPRGTHWVHLRLGVVQVEIHKNIGAQSDNRKLLLLTSINAIILTAATLAGLAATINASDPPLVALKISSTILYLAATGMLAVMNKIQPSQLAEEQRNSARLFKQLYQEIQTALAVRDPTATDHVSDAMEKVLALDREGGCVPKRMRCFQHGCVLLQRESRANFRVIQV